MNSLFFSKSGRSGRKMAKTKVVRKNANRRRSEAKDQVIVKQKKHFYDQIFPHCNGVSSVHVH